MTENKKSIESILNAEEAPTILTSPTVSGSIEDPIKPKRKKTGGKQKGWRKGQETTASTSTLVSQEVLDQKAIIDKIYLFCPKDTIPKRDIRRHIKLCTSLMETLGTSNLEDTDIAEIALIAREQIFVDTIYRTFSETQSLDTTMVVQMEKINKAIEVRKENLGSRFMDKGKKRRSKERGEMTVLDLVNDFESNAKDIQESMKTKTAEIEANKAVYTSTEDYMEGKQVNRIQVDESTDE